MQKMKTEHLRQILENLGNYEFGVNEWGSCQYSGALACFKAFGEIRKLKIPITEACEYFGYKVTYPKKFPTDKEAVQQLYQEELESLQHQILKELVIPIAEQYAQDKYKHDRPWACLFLNQPEPYLELGHYVLTESELTGNHREDFEHNVHETVNLKTFMEQHQIDPDKLDDDQQSQMDDVAEILFAESAEDLFEYAKNESWDLWSAAPHIADLYGIYLEETEETPSAQLEEGLPLFNQLAEEENIITGLACALLVEFGIITNDRAFSDFST